MTSEQLFILAIVLIVAITFAIVQVSKNLNGAKRETSDRPNSNAEAGQRKSNEPEQLDTESEPEALATEKKIKAELDRIQELIKERKKIAWETDISHHLWSLYNSYFRSSSPPSWDYDSQDGKWYELKTLRVSTKNDLKKCEFELNGTRFNFVDDEEKQGWRDQIKFFSLFLYDDSDHCLIEIPLKLRADGEGKIYSIASDSPKAFLRGDWINEFINATLKHQSIRNQEIRAQKNQERLWEIEDLKDRFGISN